MLDSKPRIVRLCAFAWALRAVRAPVEWVVYSELLAAGRRSSMPEVWWPRESLVVNLFSGLEVPINALIAAGLLRLAGRAGPRAKGLFQGVALLLIARCAWTLAELAARSWFATLPVVESGSLWRAFLEASWVVAQLLDIGTGALLLLAIHRLRAPLARSAWKRVCVVLGALMTASLGLPLATWRIGANSAPLLSLARMSGFAIEAGFVGLLFATSASLPARDTEPSAGGPYRTAEDASSNGSRWATAAAGLDLYAAALRARLWGLLFGYLLGILIARVSSLELLFVLELALGLSATGAFLAGLVMMVGAHRYAEVPVKMGARRLARLALRLMAAASLVELGGLALLLDLAGGGLPSFVTSWLPYVMALGHVLALGGALLLVSSFRKVAKHLREKALAARVPAIATRLGVTAVAVLAGRVIGDLASTSDLTPLLGVPVLLLSIFTLIGFWRLLGGVRATMRLEGSPRPGGTRKAPGLRSAL